MCDASRVTSTRVLWRSISAGVDLTYIVFYPLREDPVAGQTGKEGLGQLRRKKGGEALKNKTITHPYNSII